MKKSRMVRMVGVAVLAAAAATLGFSGTATAQVEDVPILIENLPAAAEELANGLQEAAAVAQETQSAVQTSAAVGDALVGAGQALVEGSEQFGALGLGFLLINSGVQQAMAPILGAIDDPSTAGDLISPEDVQTILDNLPGAADEASASIASGLAHLLEGNIIEPPLGIGPAFYSEAVVGTLAAVFVATDGTVIGPFVGAAGITSIIVGAAAEPQISSEVEPALAPVFEAAAPITGPVIEALRGL